jgi:hypothetical protein
MWQGVTEGNLERVLNLLKAMSPIAVIVDEADAQLGNRSSSGDSGVGNRVFAQIAAFMGNTELRGKVIWFLLTCRPDFLPVDLKRQGRAEEHIALFYPDTEEERTALVQAMLKKSGTKVSSEAERCFVERSVGLSGADIEAVLTRARMQCARQCSNGRPRRRESGARRFCPALLSHRDRTTESGGCAGVHQPQIAVPKVPRRGSYRTHPQGERVGIPDTPLGPVPNPRTGLLKDLPRARGLPGRWRWWEGDFAPGIQKAAPAARPTANFRICDDTPQAPVDA